MELQIQLASCGVCGKVWDKVKEKALDSLADYYVNQMYVMLRIQMYVLMRIQMYAMLRIQMYVMVRIQMYMLVRIQM